MIGGRVPSQRVSFDRNHAKLWWAVRLQGIAIFCRSAGSERTQWSKKVAALVLRDLQRKGLVRQRSLPAGSVFGYFGAPKVTRPPAAMSGLVSAVTTNAKFERFPDSQRDGK